MLSTSANILYFVDNVNSTTIKSTLEFHEAASFIKEGLGGVKEIVARIRNSLDAKEQASLKLQLPALTNANARRRGEITAWNKCLFLDVDGKDNAFLCIEEIKVRLKFLFGNSLKLMFTSPKGNGVKAVVPVDLELEQFSCSPCIKALKNSLYNYIISEIRVAIDLKALDLQTLCFLSYDEEVYYNSNAEPFNLSRFYTNVAPEPPGIVNKTKTKTKTTNLAPAKAILPVEEAYLQQIEKGLAKKGYSFTPGNRHGYVLKLAQTAVAAGVKRESVLNYCLRKQEPDFNYNEIRDIVSYFDENESISGVTFTVSEYLSEIRDDLVKEVLEGLQKGNVLIHAPTGSGKTTFLATLINAINANVEGLRQHVICEPNVLIVEEAAEKLGIKKIHEGVLGKEKETAFRAPECITTVAQAAAVITHAYYKGIPKEGTFIYIDEQHALLESFRLEQMQELIKATEGRRVVYLSGTPNLYVHKELNIKRVIRVNKTSKSTKKLQIIPCKNGGGYYEQIKRLLQEGKRVSFYCNNIYIIKQVIEQLVKDGVLQDKQIGVVAAAQTLHKGDLEAYSCKKDLVETNKIPRIINFFAYTKAVEYGFSILNDNFNDIIIFEHKPGAITAPQIQQLTARFRANNNYNIYFYTPRNAINPYCKYFFKAHKEQLDMISLDALDKLNNRKDDALKALKDVLEDDLYLYDALFAKDLKTTLGFYFDSKQQTFKQTPLIITAKLMKTLDKGAGYLDIALELDSYQDGWEFLGVGKKEVNKYNKPPTTKTKKEAKKNLTAFLLRNTENEKWKFLSSFIKVGATKFKVRTTYVNSAGEVVKYAPTYTPYDEQNYQVLTNLDFFRGGGVSLINTLIDYKPLIPNPYALAVFAVGCLYNIRVTKQAYGLLKDWSLARFVELDGYMHNQIPKEDWKFIYHPELTTIAGELSGITIKEFDEIKTLLKQTHNRDYYTVKEFLVILAQVAPRFKILKDGVSAYFMDIFLRTKEVRIKEEGKRCQYHEFQYHLGLRDIWLRFLDYLIKDVEKGAGVQVNTNLIDWRDFILGAYKDGYAKFSDIKERRIFLYKD